MPATRSTASAVPAAAPVRREPVQARSRARVGAILDATEKLVVERGVAALTTRDIAATANVPVASLYQYFADKEAVLVALAERDMAEMDDQVATDVAALPVISVRTLVEASMGAFVKVYHRRRAFVEIYLRGRTNPVLHEFGREHNARVAETLRQLAIDVGLVSSDLDVLPALLAVEVGDRVFQLAFEHDDQGDQALVAEGISLMIAYLERFATPEGLVGIPNAAA